MVVREVFAISVYCSLPFLSRKLPLSVRRALNIEEGDFLDVRVNEGEILLRVKKLVDKEQAWFWTKRWQEGEKEAQEDIAAGRVHDFGSAGESITYLRATC